MIQMKTNLTSGIGSLLIWAELKRTYCDLFKNRMNLGLV